jgi:archaellum biogenesis protein FlaJ (TadC family)
MSSSIRSIANNIVQLSTQCESTESAEKRLQYLNSMLKNLDKIEKEIKGDSKGSVFRNERSHLINELKIDPTHLEEAIHPKETNKYYSGSVYGKIANLFFEPITRRFLENFPNGSKNIHKRLLGSGIKFLSVSYISIMLFTSFLLLFLGSIIGVMLFANSNALLGIGLGVGVSILSFLTFYFYPIYLIKVRKKRLNEELPFLISHFTAIANTGIVDISLFKAVLKSDQYRYLNVELRRIINGVEIFGYSLHKSISSVASTVPSALTKEFLIELGEVLYRKKDLKEFLNTKSRIGLSKYRIAKSSNVKRFGHSFQETTNVFKKLRFKLSYLFGILAGVGILAVDFLLIEEGTFLFIFLLLVGTIIGWAMIILDIFKITAKDQLLEQQFLWFVRDLKVQKSLLKINKDYKELNPYVKKLQNQYKIGIPLEKALVTFANDTDSVLIQSSISTVLESQRHGANFFEALDQIATSKILRKRLKLDKS